MQEPCSELFDSGTFLGTSHVYVEHRGLDELVEAVEGFMIVNTEDEVCFEEFIEGGQGCLGLSRDGLVVNNDMEPLDVVLLFTNAQQEGLAWFQTWKEGLNTGSNLQKRRDIENYEKAFK